MRKIAEFTQDHRMTRVYRDSVNNEFYVKYIVHGTHLGTSDYFTSDKDDALSTAKVMIGWIDPAIAAAESGKQRRTTKLLDAMRGHINEFARLQGILCMSHALDHEDDKLVSSCFDNLRIAQRMDEINAAALRGAA